MPVDDSTSFGRSGPSERRRVLADWRFQDWQIWIFRCATRYIVLIREAVGCLDWHSCVTSVVETHSSDITGKARWYRVC